MRKILPESLDREVALRTSELGDNYEKMRSFIMKYALQERAASQSSKAMDTSVVSRANLDPAGWEAYNQWQTGLQEVDYSQAYYEENPWDMPASTGYDASAAQWDPNTPPWDVNAVAFI